MKARSFRYVRPGSLAAVEVGRPAERGDLVARVVDVVFLRHRPAGLGHQVGERIADCSLACVAEVQWSGRVGRHEFHLHTLAGTDRALAIGLAGGIGYLVLPIGIMILFSFNDSPIPNLWRGFTLKWYAALAYVRPDFEPATMPICSR